MLYALLDNAGALVRYPYTLTDLRRDQPGTSFPTVIDDSTAATFGVVPVEPSPEPAFDHTVDVARTAQLVAGKWVEVWTSTPADPAVVAERTATKAESTRSERNALLVACDWTQLADSPLDAAAKAAWSQYRQALRDVTDQQGFPWSVSWPVAP